MNDSERTKKTGFSLAELLVVVAIIAVLIAVSIPIFTALTAKSRASADMANLRSAKAAASNKYLSEQPAGVTTYYYDAESGKVTTSQATAASFAGYGKSDVQIKGASGYPVKDGKPQIVSVTFTSDGSSTAAWGMGGELDTLIAKALAYNVKNHSGQALISAMGTLPSVAVTDIFGDKKLYGGETTLYWRPKEITINGTREVFLYAAGGSTGHASWQGYAIYYNGTTYRSTVVNSYSRLTDKNSVLFSSADVGKDLGTYLLNSGKWEAAK